MKENFPVKTQYKLFYVSILILAQFSNGCKNETPSTTPPSSTTTQTASATFTNSPTSPAMPTVTLTPTVRPSQTQTHTPTPTFALPVDISTPLPENLHEITADNITNIREIVRTGSPVIRGNWFSNDGKLGFIASTDGLVVYDLATKQIIKIFDVILPPQESYPDYRLSLNSDGTRFSILTDEKVEVWDINQGKIFELLFDKIGANFDRPYYVTISPDGKLLGVGPIEMFSEGREWAITLYDIDNAQILDGQPSFTGFFFSFSPDGTWFITSMEENGGGILWRTADWSRVRNIVINSSQTFRGFSSDDKLIAVQDDNYVLIYQVEEWKLIRQISMPINDSRYQSTTKFSPDGSKIGISSEAGISVWDIATGDRINTYPEITSEFKISNDGFAISFTETLEEIYQSLNTENQEGYFLWDSKLQYQNDTNSLIVLRKYYHPYIDNQRKYLGCTMPLGGITKCQESSEPTFINRAGGFYSLRTTDEKSVYEIYSAFDDAQNSFGEIHSDSDYIEPFWISGDRKYLFLSRYSSSTRVDNTEIWDISSGKLIKRWPGYKTHFAHNLNGNILIFVVLNICGNRNCGNDLIVYDISANQVLHSKAAKQFTEFTALTFAPDGKIIYSVGEHRQEAPFVEFFDLDPETRKESPLGVSVNMDDYYYFDSIAFSPNGRLFAIGLTDGIIRVFDTLTYKEIHSWQAQNGMITYLEFTYDGNLLFSASLDEWRGDGYIRAWGLWP